MGTGELEVTGGDVEDGTVVVGAVGDGLSFGRGVGDTVVVSKGHFWFLFCLCVYDVEFLFFSSINLSTLNRSTLDQGEKQFCSFTKKRDSCVELLVHATDP